MATKAKPRFDPFAILQESPERFLYKTYGSNLWGKQSEIIRSVRDNRYTSVASCHASGKSFTAGNVATWFLNAYPYSIVLTTAPTFRQVQDVLWKEIRTLHAKATARGIHIEGKVNSTDYTIADNWFAVGLSTNDPDRFNGYHARYILIIVDESSGVPPAIFDAIQGVASTGHVRILELGNPTDPTGHFAGTFKSPFYHKINISCFDTPNFDRFRAASEADSIALLRESTDVQRDNAITMPYLISPEWVFQRLLEWGEESPMFQARCLGTFPLEGDDTLIPLRYALQAKWDIQSGKIECANDIYGTEEVLGVDVARFGHDSTVFAHRVGNRILPLERFRKQDTMATVGKIVRWKIQNPWGKIHVDEPGVGGGVIDRLRELDVDSVAAINVGEAAYRKEEFINKRAEFYWALKVRFQEGDIAIPDDDQLISQLTSLKVDFKSNGKIKIEEKADMRKRGLPSPDDADAVMLAFAPTNIGAFHKSDGLDGIAEDEDDVPGNITGDLLGTVY